MAKQLTLPPITFSNAMNSIYDDWDFTNWQESKEWKLFNAGKAAAARDIMYEAQLVAEESDKRR